MTAREIQATAKVRFPVSLSMPEDWLMDLIETFLQAKGMPWTVAKGYDTFTPISDFVCVGVLLVSATD